MVVNIINNSIANVSIPDGESFQPLQLVDLPEHVNTIRMHRGNAMAPGEILALCAEAGLGADVAQNVLGLPEAAVKNELARVKEVTTFCKVARVGSLAPALVQGGISPATAKKIIVSVLATIDESIGEINTSFVDGPAGAKPVVRINVEEVYRKLNGEAR
jgi:hypothetical protein